MQLQEGFETNVVSIQLENEFLNTKFQKTSFKKRLLSTSRKYIQNMYSTYIRPAFLKSWLVIKMTRGLLDLCYRFFKLANSGLKQVQNLCQQIIKRKQAQECCHGFHFEIIIKVCLRFLLTSSCIIPDTTYHAVSIQGLSDMQSLSRL